MTKCNICPQIRHYLEDLSAVGKVNCGPLKEIPNIRCPCHKPLLQQFYEYLQDRKIQPRDSEDVGIVARGKGSSPVLTESITKLGATWGILFANRVPDHPGIGRILNPDWVDVTTVQKWKNECLKKHSKCENPLEMWPARPAWLVDIEQKCVVSGDSDVPFVALSYRWGTGFELRLDEKDFEKSKKPNALEDPGLLEKLPAIVAHAMYLTLRLGERYLWVDSLCIPRSDIDSANEELNQMGAIYANAAVTIIAADDDAKVGIKGLEDVSPSRELEQRVIPFDEDQIIVRNTNIFSMGSGTPYYERAWTYQEYMMSKRRVLFIRKEAHWECSQCVWHEDLEYKTEIDKYINPRLVVINAGFPELGSLHHTITRYNERKLTFPEDALPGISGLLSVFSRTFTGGFLYGLAEMQFERGLCWSPYWDHTELVRRVNSNRSDNERVSSFGLPSWSWIGWQGLIGWDYTATLINPRMSRFSETIPITEWYTWDIHEGKTIRRIRSTWFENLDKYKDSATPLPEGWTKHDPSELEKFRDEEQLYPDGCGEYVYKHERMPKDDNQFWFYPFPVPKIDSTTRPFMPEQTEHLFCKTKRTHIRAFRDKDDSNRDENQTNTDVGLYDQSMNVIGTLRVHTHEQLSQFPRKTVESTIAEGKLLELVAICRSRLYSKSFNKDKKMFDKINPPEDVYNVLWVEWTDQIAYRCASGRVNKAVWESFELEDVDLVLG